MTDHDPPFDDRLRQVPLPAGLQAGVRIERLFDDAAIDRLVGRVAIPSGLAERVRSAARPGTGGSGVVDLSRFAIRATPARPAVTAGNPRRVRLGGLVRLAREAGAVATALGLALLVALTGIEVSRRLEGPLAVPMDGSGAPPEMEFTGPAPETPPHPQPPSGEERAEFAHAPAAVALSPSGGAVPDGLSEPRNGRQVTGSASSAATRPAAAEPARGSVIARGAPVVAFGWQTPPTMSTVAPPRASRRTVPRSPAFDLAFEMAHGEAPFVDPSADPDLAIDRPPLTLATDGFDALLESGLTRRARFGDRPVRVEEVLAAMPPPPALVAAGDGAVRLGLHAVPSGRMVGGIPTLLLEAAVYVPGDTGPGAEPLRTTLILDQSAAGEGRAWPRICRGLAAVAARLEPAARISVILCGSRPRVAIRDAAPAAIVAAAASWERLPPAASADLDAGLALAGAEASQSSRTIVVAHAVTLDRGRAAVADALAEWHRSVATAGGDTVTCSPRMNGPRFVIIDPSATELGGGIEPTFGRTGSDAAAIRRELVRQVTGRPSLVARQCRLEIRFDPARVARYRVIGHRQSAVESLAADAASGTDLHAGETARVVYEVVPRRAAGADLATAVLTWRSPDGGTHRLAADDQGRDDRGGTAVSPHGRSLLLAVWLGEFAGGSAHQADGGRQLARLTAIADAWRSEGTITPFAATLADILDAARR